MDIININVSLSKIRIERGEKKNIAISEGFCYKGSRITTSANRCILFNILLNKFYINFLNKTCADLCCGSGIVGFEFLSLGAKKCVFVDNDKNKIRNIITVNNKLNYKIDTIYGFLPNVYQLKEPFDLIFFDPPYDNNFCEQTIKNVYDNKILNKNGILIIETLKEIKELYGFTLLHKKELKNKANFIFLTIK